MEVVLEWMIFLDAVVAVLIQMPWMEVGLVEDFQSRDDQFHHQLTLRFG